MKKLLYTFATLLISFQLLTAQALYETDNLTIITITFEDDNWNETLTQYYNDDNGERLLADVEINGNPFDSVGIRYRGGSTFDETFGKNPLNIKLDHIKNQDYQSFEVLKLSNGAKDPSFLREVASYELAREYMIAPQANYAQIFINGTYHGLYANVESINRRFVEKGFSSDNDNPRFEASPDYDFDFPNPPFGCTEGHGSGLEYLGDGIVCYFDHYDISSTTGWEELRDAAETLQNNPDNLREVLDVDRFLWMSAFNNWLVNLDSYLGAVPNNYFLFQQDNGLFAPIVNDLNESFGRYPLRTIDDVDEPQPSELEMQTLSPFLGEGDDSKPFLKAVFENPTLQRMYFAHYRTMLKENIENGALEARLQDLQNLINSGVSSELNPIYNFGQFEDNLNLTVTDEIYNENAYALSAFLNPRYNFLQSFPEFSATQPEISNNQNFPNNPLAFSDVSITATVSNANTVLIGTRETIQDAFELTEMFDDGNHDDGAAGDGVYGATIAIGLTGVQYYIYAENDEAGKFSPERAEIEFHNIGAGGDVVINELMADNETTATDPDGQFEDWVELYNNTPATIDLSGWYLSDKTDNLTKWEFPVGTFIDGNSTLIVWTDDDEGQDGLHTNFTLSNNGEAVVLTNSDFQVVDQIIFGQQFDDVSFARCPNGTGAFEMKDPTFDADNTSACVVGTYDLVLGQNFKIYPNPAADFLNIELQSIDNQKYRIIKIFDVIGKSVYENNFFGNIEIDLNKFSNGIYFVKIEGARMEKVIVQR